MLSKEDTQVDLVMVDVSASDLQGFRLLYDAVNAEVTVILMSANATPSLIKCAIEDGAFLFIQKPATVDLLKYLWQYVFREKTRKYRENLRCREFITENQDNVNEDTTKNQNQNQARSRRTSRNGDTDKRVRGKMCTEWTLELHRKFIDAVRELGEGRCYPIEILQLMNVPGLKRMQVASHLQRCRAGWQHPEERDSTAPSKASNQSNNSCRLRTYGLFPHMIGGPQDPLLVEANEHVSYTMNNPTPSPGMGQHGTVSINNDVTERSDQNFHGNMAAANQELQLPDSSFDFANEDPTENLCMQDFQLDDSLSGQVFTRDNEEAGGFWSAWVSSFSGDL